ncbi:hypothetical protein QVD17_04310 [Tagetes erecta]|uniref:Uncharacterized protein n=1 Tax=Tagetes erecta TaxID=13708 RepID=A0AAD8LG22_TARER|nr:hypothetical protein QVD17_04310 [Tagetes erecta]
MASVQCQKPVDHTKNTTQYTHAPANTQNTCNSCGNQKPVDHTKTSHPVQNEHSFTNKMKEMASSAYKKVADQMHHHDQHNNGHRPNSGPKPAGPKPAGPKLVGPKLAGQKPAGPKQKESSMSNCIPRIGDHIKRDKNSRKKKGNNGKRKDGSGSSSSSDSESDTDAHVKRI